MSRVRIAHPADADEVARTLATGFQSDPVLTWVFGEPDRAEKLGEFFGFLAREALVPLGATFVAPGAVASWTPPDPPPWPRERNLRFAEVLEGVCTADDLARLDALDAATRVHHPEVRHWYLGTIATVPERRGQGLGSKLLRESLAVVDRDRLPAYLESTNPQNVRLYERFGFVVTTDIELPEGPTITAMWRDPPS